jgi:regulator of protease activity HflC (stomatin/prohibitin superfamily)
MLSTAVRLFISVFIVLITMASSSFCLAMTNMANDFAVGAGYLGVLLVLLISITLMYYIWKPTFRRLFRFIGLFAVIPFLWGCGTTVEPGYVGIKVNKWGNQRGVNDFPIHTGWVSYNPWTESVISYPTFNQTAVWTHDVNEGNPVNEEITFTNKDSLKISADISLAYEMIPDKVPAFYVKFRSDDIKTFTHGFLRNIAREKFDSVSGKYPIEAIMGDNATLLAEVRKQLQDEIAPYGVHITQFGFIGAPRPPQAVIDAINMKIKATQDAMRVENELRQQQAEAQKAIAWAEGQAKSNRLLAESVSPQLLEWKRLELQFRITDRWNGASPTYYSAQPGSGPNPFIQVK